MIIAISPEFKFNKKYPNINYIYVMFDKSTDILATRFNTRITRKKN